MAHATAVSGIREATWKVASSRGLMFLVAAVVTIVLGWGIAAGASSVLLVGLAALPLLVVFGYRYSFALVVFALVLRPLIDSSGVIVLTGGVGLALIGLAVVVALHDVRALALLVGVAVPVGVAAWIGWDRWGAVAGEEALRIISVAAIAAIVLVTPTPLTRVLAARVVQVSGLVPVVVAISQLVLATGTPIGEVLRTSGTLSQANPAAHFFGLCALASLVLAVEGRRRLLDGSAVVLFSFGVLTTGSIGGVAALVVALLGYTALVYRVASRQFLRALGVLVLTVAVAALTPLGQGRINEFFAPSGPEVPDNSLTWRFTTWDTVMDSWRTSPITGLGLGATTEGAILPNNIAHSEYIYVLAEAGIVGALVVLSFVAAYVGFMLRFRRLGASRLNLALAGAVLMGLAVDSAIDNPAHFSPSMYVCALLLTVAWRCSSDERALASAPDIVDRVPA